MSGRRLPVVFRIIFMDYVQDNLALVKFSNSMLNAACTGKGAMMSTSASDRCARIPGR